MSEALRAMFRRFGDVDAPGASRLYARIALAIADDPAPAAFLLDAPETQRLPVLFFACVHAVLFEERTHDLARFFPDLSAPADPGDPMPALRDFVATHDERLRALAATRNTQTNEAQRAAALIPALGLVQQMTGRSLALLEPGPSAGFLLNLDRYAYRYDSTTIGSGALRIDTEVRGVLPPLPKKIPDIVARAGIDLDPTDVFDDERIAWLRACIWPEQHDRMKRLDQAIAITRANPPSIITGDAVDLLPDVARTLPDDAALVVFHSLFAPYLPHADRDRLAAQVQAIATERGEVFWLHFEGSGTVAQSLPFLDVPAFQGGATVALAHLRPVGRRGWLCAHAGWHGQWIEWRPAISADRILDTPWVQSVK